MESINIDKLSVEIMKNLDTYLSNTVDDVEHAVKVVARETAEELRDTSPTMSGDYAKSWSYHRDKTLSGKDRFSMVVYNKKPNYRVTHLLEFGHDKVNNRGFVDARPHIKAAEQKALVWLGDMLTKPK